MKKKMGYKIAVDVVMTVLLMFLMARQITGDSAHEWLGAGMFVLWIVHHILNRNWYSRLFKGRYTPVRIMQIFVNSAVLFSMPGLMVSGVILSKEVFAFLPISGGVAFARSLHVVSAFWGFVLMAFHLGLHWNMVLGMVKNVVGTVSPEPVCFLLRAAAVLIAGYGVYAFAKNHILSYLFLTSQFVFFDFDKPVWMFFAEYIAILSLFVFLAYYSSKGIQRWSGTGKKLVEKEKGAAGP